MANIRTMVDTSCWERIGSGVWLGMVGISVVLGGVSVVFEGGIANNNYHSHFVRGKLEKHNNSVQGQISSL